MLHPVRLTASTVRSHTALPRSKHAPVPAPQFLDQLAHRFRSVGYATDGQVRPNWYFIACAWRISANCVSGITRRPAYLLSNALFWLNPAILCFRKRKTLLHTIAARLQHVAIISHALLGKDAYRLALRGCPLCDSLRDPGLRFRAILLSTGGTDFLEKVPYLPRPAAHRRGMDPDDPRTYYFEQRMSGILSGIRSEPARMSQTSGTHCPANPRENQRQLARARRRR
jgi:hypothetical protein